MSHAHGSDVGAGVIRFHHPALRRTFVGVHAAFWAAFAATLSVGLARPLHGLSSRWLPGLDQEPPQTIETLLAVTAAGVAVPVEIAMAP